MTAHTDMTFETVSIEMALAAALEAMRHRATYPDPDADPDDAYERYAATLPDRRPLIVVGVIGESDTLAWMFQPGLTQGRDTVLAAGVHHLQRPDGTSCAFGAANVGVKDFLVAELERRISWLHRERTGEFLPGSM